MPQFAIGLIVLHAAAVVAAIISAYLPDRNHDEATDPVDTIDAA